MRQRAGIAAHGKTGVGERHKLGKRHRPPDAFGRENGRKREDEKPTHDEAARNGDDERVLRAEDGLEVIRRENVHGQEDKRYAVAPDDRGSDGENCVCRAHEDADIEPRRKLTQSRPESGEGHGRTERKIERLPDAGRVAGSIVCREDRLRGLPDAVGAALDKGRNIDDGCVDRERVGAEIFHDLAVKEHRENAHGNVDKEARKAGNSNLSELFEKILHRDEPQRTFFAQKVRAHDEHGHDCADRCGKARAEYAKVQREHAEPVAEDVENAAGEHCRRGKAGTVVVPEKARDKLAE